MKKVVKLRDGFTLIETLVALTLLSMLIATTLSAVDRQVKLFAAGATQMDAMQNGRFAMGELEKDLPTAGTNIAEHQPYLVYADTSVVAFNADYVSNRSNDPSAIYIDTAASDLYATAVRRARQFIIPRTNVAYPDSNFRSGRGNSPAETIIFYFSPDTLTSRTDDFILYRKVNDQPADLLARSLLHTPGQPFFQYQRRIVPAVGNPFLQVVGAAGLPMRHLRPWHAAVDDTGAVATIDQLKAVTVNLRVTDGQPGAKEKIYKIVRTIALPNVGMATKMTCGDEPILGANGFTAVRVLVGGAWQVRLTWNPAVDESGGEKDVLRYVIYRSTTAGVAAIEDPFLSIAAGQASYTFVDATVTPGVGYYYWLAAQDCTPALSEPLGAPVVIP